MLVVTISISPPVRAQDLPSVINDSGAILESATSVPLTTMALSLPAVLPLIRNMAINNMVHFACHGRPGPKNPLQSPLVLNDGVFSVAHNAHGLAGEIDLAYFSASSTADHKDGKLVNEGIHVVSNFQFSRFQNFIRTL
jgi:hypothetical protein